MDPTTAVTDTPMHVLNECLVVQIQTKLGDDSAVRIQRDILRRIDESSARRVILDVSGLNVIDSFLAQTISDTARMASLLGATTVLVGLKPEVVASLVDMECQFGDIRTARNLQQGLDILDSILRPDVEVDDDEQRDVVDMEDRNADLKDENDED